MTGREVYEAFLHELKHEHTTSATPDEFNHHIWRGEMEYCMNRYFAQDQHQKTIDDLAFITIETNGIAGMPAPLANQGQNIAGQEWFAMPEDLMILLNVSIRSQIFDDPCVPDGTLSKFTVAHYLSADREKTVHESYYSKPSHEYPCLYYKIRQRNILPKVGNSIAQECVITYLQYPDKIEVDVNTGDSITDSPFGDSQTMEIVRWAVWSYLETIESMRAQSMALIENRKFLQSPPPNTFIQ